METAEINSKDTIVAAMANMAISGRGEKKTRRKKQENTGICDVCCDQFTKTARCPIICLYCDKAACKVCCQRFILGEEHPSCLYCRKAWNREFLDAHFAKAFINGSLKDKRQDVLLSYEEALLPATQTIARATREKEIVVERRKELDHLERERYQAMLLILDNPNKSTEECSQVQAAWLAVRVENNNIKRRITQLNHVIHGRAALEDDENHQLNQNATRVRVQFIKHCPTEGCNGFLSTEHKCGMCGTEVCHKCLHVVREGHQCDPNEVASAFMLMRDTKPCPKCATLIHKTDGCDQMWCTKCHTAFSWRTLKIETGRIHNPHWYEWQRLNSRDGNIPREPGDDPRPPCREDRPRFPSFGRLMRTGRMTLKLEAAHQLLVHIQHVELDRYRSLQNNPFDNKDLRVKHLLGKITKEGWKKLLQERDKRRQKEQAMRHALEVLLFGAVDVWRAFTSTTEPLPAEETEAQLNALRIYTNECIADVIRRFDCTIRFSVDEEWTICR